MWKDLQVPGASRETQERRVRRVRKDTQVTMGLQDKMARGADPEKLVWPQQVHLEQKVDQGVADHRVTKEERESVGRRVRLG